VTDRPTVFVDLLSYTGTKGGMETYTRELYRELGTRDTGMQFVGLASREGGRLDLSWFPGRVVRSRISGENRVVWAFGELVASAASAVRRRADVVHCPATLGPLWTPMPTVLTVHDMLYWSHPEFMVTPLYTRPVKWMERRAAANAARIITDSQVSADEIVRFLGFPAERLHVVPLAATSHRNCDIPLRDRDNLIVASGHRRPYKNWDGLIRALALVDEAVRPRLVITGSTDGTSDPLLPVVAAEGLAPWVDVRGWVTEQELTDLYQRARAMVMPTFAEGFGLPVLEAMAAGLPVLASDIPVLREVGGDAAVWFDPHDGASIARAITLVVCDPDLLQRNAEAGKTQAARFSWRRVGDETLAVLRSALEGQRPRA
jgi:glycosyltransferase involved in cell wall biosynthesis